MTTSERVAFLLVAGIVIAAIWVTAKGASQAFGVSRGEAALLALGAFVAAGIVMSVIAHFIYLDVVRRIREPIDYPADTDVST
jgi:Co/Zn/Cd efflux system component